MSAISNLSYVTTARLLFTTTLMFLAGIVAWWSWIQTGQAGLKYALIGAVVVLLASFFLGRWKIYANNRK